MLVLAAPNTQDPRDDGFVHTLPGELVVRPGIVCDAGRDGTGCGCERSWSGITTGKGTTLAVVVDRQHGERSDYIDVITRHYRDTWQWEQAAAREDAVLLLDLAVDFGEGTHVTIATHDGHHVFDALEA